MSRRVVASRPWRTITVRAATQTSRRRRSVRSAVEVAEVVITVVTTLPSRGQCRQCARQDADRGGDIVLAGELVRAVADAAIQAAHEQHPGLHTGAREDAGVVAGTGRQLDGLHAGRGG